ncbi:MAG: carboxypeptidase-like regulatory domain-containing protein, partial [Ginsengibacter sp.]
MILTVSNQNKKVAQSLNAKTWMIMKLTIVLLLFFTFQVSAKIHAQRITIVKNNIHLSEVFRDIEKQTGYLFFYDKALIKNTGPIDVSIKDATLSQALSSCLKGQRLTYSIVRNTIVIQPLKINPPPVQYSLLTPEPPSIELHGRVVNQKGQPLQNVSVMISGTKIGTTTDKDGQFSLTVSNNKNIELEISSVGYQTKKVKVEGQTEINVTLELEV